MANLNTLLDSCKLTCNSEVILAIKNNISLFNKLLEAYNELQSITMLNIIGYYHVLSLLNATASDDVMHYLKCSALYTISRHKD